MSDTIDVEINTSEKILVSIICDTCGKEIKFAAGTNNDNVIRLYAEPCPCNNIGQN